MATTDVNQYLGNPLLKKANVPVEFTKEQIQEYQKCMDDPIHFIQEHMKIVSLDEGLVPFKMYDFQKHMVPRRADKLIFEVSPFLIVSTTLLILGMKLRYSN